MATATATRPPRAAISGDTFTGTGTLVRFMLRRDRIRLPAWAVGFAAFAGYVISAIPLAYGTEEELGSVVSLFGDPVGRMLTGPGYGFTEPTFARLVANGYGLYFVILAALMNILLVNRHTRVEEQAGRSELIRAAVVGRAAQLTAALIVAIITNLVIAVAVIVPMLGAGYEASGSVLFGVAIAAGGLSFAGLTALTAQITEYSRAAAGIAGAVLGAAFVVRAGGDMAAEGGSALSWFSPLAWPQQTAPFVLDRWWPLILSLGLAVLSTAAGYALSARRDVGASFLSARPGPAEAASWLRSPLAFALRLQRASLIGWGAGLMASGLVFGAYTDALLHAFEDLPDIFADIFGSAEQIVAGYLGYMAVFMALLVGVFAVLAVQSLRAEETSERMDPVLATPVSRVAWLGSYLVVTAVGVVVLLVATGAVNGIGAAIVTGDTTHIRDLTLAHLNQAPAVLVVLGIAALLFGVLPRAIAATWVIIGYGLIASTFGPLLDLPDWAYNLSPFEHPARMPLESFDAPPVLVLIVVAAVTAAVGLVRFRLRNVNVS